MILKTDYQIKGDFKYYQTHEYMRQEELLMTELEQIKSKEFKSLLGMITEDIVNHLFINFTANNYTMTDIYDLEDLININLEAEVRKLIFDDKVTSSYFDKELMMIWRNYGRNPELFNLSVSYQLLEMIYFLITQRTA